MTSQGHTASFLLWQRQKLVLGHHKDEEKSGQVESGWGDVEGPPLYMPDYYQFTRKSLSITMVTDR